MKTFSALGKKIENLIDHLPNLDKLPDAMPGQCPYCDGYGNIIDERGARPCSCVRREMIQSEYIEARIPELYRDATLESFVPYKVSLKAQVHELKEFVSNYSKENSIGMYIYGNTGCGKTHLAIGILKGLIKKNYSGVFYNVVELLDAIRETYDPNNPANPKSRLEQEFKRQVFVLDDFGAQKTSSWVSDRLYALINRRYQNKKTLIITSNIPMHQLLMRVDDRLASRIIDMCKEFQITADDYRQRNRDKVSYKPKKNKFGNRT